jgi:hypothetical protein
VIQKLVNGTKMWKCFKINKQDSRHCFSNVNSSSKSHTIGKRVTFRHVDIREFKRVLIDHPECKDGLALGLDWMHGERTTRISIELFEQIRRKQGKGSKPAVRLSFQERRKILILIGGYREEILREILHESRICKPNLDLTKARAA